MSEIWAHYVEILTDPAHLLVEVTLMLVVDVLFMGMTLPLVKRWVRRHDAQAHPQVAHICCCETRQSVGPGR